VKCASIVLAFAFGLLCSLASAQGASGDSASEGQADQASQGQASKQASKHVPAASPSVLVRASHLREAFNRATRYAHSMPEVSGTEITVTRKTTVVDLTDMPPVIDNHERDIFDQMPGIVIAEQQNPTELNLSYRGLGNPQESEYILVMQDGIPMEMDWIGYPTLYYIPVPETIAQVQMIRGGSGLLYGPEPEPVINFVSLVPGPKTAGTTQQVFGSDGLYSTFNSISGAEGRWDYLADFSHRQSDGQRANGDYTLNSGDMQLGFRIDSQQKLDLAVHAYSLDSGLAGLMSHAQYVADPNQTTTPDDRDWADRYTAVLTYQNQINASDLFVQKLWSGYQDLITRSDTYTVATVPVGTGATLAGQRFHYTGLDGRFLHRWGRGNALTVGYTAYGSQSPYTEITSTDALIAPYGASGSLFYNDERKTRYGAVFAENLFRLPGRVHVVTSARLDHEQLDTLETVAPHPVLANGEYSRTIPLFGIGVGNDFGRGNETYLNVSEAYRPMRYLDIASPFSNFSPDNNPQPTKYVTYEAGVHGWPLPGLFYDASLFQVNVRNSIESEQFTPTETIDVNTGNIRSRGAELDGSFDLLQLWSAAPSDEHLTLFANASLLNARYTGSMIPGETGKTPVYAPNYVLKAGLTLRAARGLKLSLLVDSVASQYFQDSDEPDNGTPALIPTYTVADFSGEYTFAGHWRVLGGISNLTDRRYYSRVFLSGGSIEPALTRQFYAGVAYDL
jgi:Fe(3+) dicitrate transport protein